MEDSDGAAPGPTSQEDSIVKVGMVDIEKLTPYEGNPRVNEAVIEAVARSIRELGVRQPIVVDEHGVIVVGHTRWKAARKLGL